MVGGAALSLGRTLRLTLQGAKVKPGRGRPRMVPETCPPLDLVAVTIGPDRSKRRGCGRPVAASRSISTRLRRWMHGFKLVAVGVENEGGVIVGAVLRPEARSPFILAAESQGGRVEMVDGLSAGRAEGQMESRPGRRHRIGLEDEQQDVL